VNAALPKLAQTTGLASETAGILFGESQSRFVISCPVEDTPVLREHLEGATVPFLELGPVGGDRIVVGSELDVSVRDAQAAYDAALEPA
jgi:phosphoribosylformylglycinamidine synthase subunit PurL